jgi:hypothetical protein
LSRRILLHGTGYFIKQTATVSEKVYLAQKFSLQLYFETVFAPVNIRHFNWKGVQKNFLFILSYCSQ